MDVLVVEDDASVADALELLLAPHGYRVARARNGTEALEMYEASRFNVIVTDIFMPEMDGLELIQAIRKKDVHIKIVAMSGDSRILGAALLPVAKHLGATHILEKPFTPHELVSCLNEAAPPTAA
jgi:CheY-like chemotaxis protein